MVGVGSVGLSWCPGVVVNVVVGVVGLVRDSVVVDPSGILGVVGGVVDSDSVDSDSGMRCAHASGLAVTANELLFLLGVAVAAAFHIGGIRVHLSAAPGLSL